MSRSQAAALFNMGVTNIFWQRGQDHLVRILHPDIIPWPDDIYARHDWESYYERGSFCEVCGQ